MAAKNAEIMSATSEYPDAANSETGCRHDHAADCEKIRDHSRSIGKT